MTFQVARLINAAGNLQQGALLTAVGLAAPARKKRTDTD
jgi:hypothetical protein